MTPELRSLLVTEAERALDAVAARSAAVSRWERDAEQLRTLVNVGRLADGEERFPADEVYPLDSFPAEAALVRHGRAFVDPRDLASLALDATYAYGSKAGVPIMVAGAVWGELWAARAPGEPRLTAGDVDRLHAVAAGLGEALALQPQAQPSR